MINCIKILIAYCQRLLWVAGLAVLLTGPGWAQSEDPFIPNFWDKHERFVKPDMSSVVRLRFLTTTDFPPFNFIDRSKRLTGFHVDLAKAICNELGLLQRCQIQALPWDELSPALEKGDGEAIIAGMAISPDTREKLDFSKPYFHIPARFVALNDSQAQEPMYMATSGKTVGVVKNSIHEAYYDQVFGKRKFNSYETRFEALDALMKREVDAVFTDSVSLSFWLASENSRGCCRFVGGPYLSEKFFGKGMAIALPKGEDVLRDGINYALKQINDKGLFGELYLKYFPIGIF